MTTDPSTGDPQRVPGPGEPGADNDIPTPSTEPGTVAPAGAGDLNPDTALTDPAAVEPGTEQPRVVPVQQDDEQLTTVGEQPSTGPDGEPLLGAFEGLPSGPVESTTVDEPFTDAAEEQARQD